MLLADTATLPTSDSGIGSTTSQQTGQNFTATATGPLQWLTVAIRKNSANTTDALLCNIYAVDASGFPTGASLASSSVDAALLTTANTDYTFTFATPPTLTNGVKYVAVFSRTGALHATYYYGIAGVVAAAYAGGTAIRHDGASWVNLNMDFRLVAGNNVLPVTITGLSTAVAPVGPFKSTNSPQVGSPWTGTSTAAIGDNTTHLRAFFYTPSTNWTFDAVSVDMQRVNSPTDNLTLTIRSGTPTGTVVATSNEVVGSSVPTAYSSVAFTFSTAVTINASTKYYFVIARTGAQDNIHYWNVHGHASDILANAGQAISPNGSTWNADSSNDLVWVIGGVTAYYFFGRDAANAFMLQAYKATDPTSSWAPIGAPNNISANIATIVAYQVGDIIHLGVTWTVATPATGYTYLQYDTSTDTFLTKEAIIATSASTAGQTGAQQTGIALVVRSSGEVVAFFNGVQTKTSGTFRARVYYSRRTAVNTWTAAVQVDNNGAIDSNNPVAVLGAGDRVHFSVFNQTNSLAGTRTLSAANALSANVLNINSTTVPFTDSVAYDRSGTTKVVFTSGTVGQFTLTYDSVDSPPAPLYAVTQNIATATAPHRIGYDPDDFGVTIVYRSSTDSDLYAIKSTDDGATFGAAVLFFAGTVANSDAAVSRSATGSLYARGASVVIGYVVNDNGTWKYNEYNVRTLGASGTGTLVAGVADADGAGVITTPPAEGTGALAAQSAGLVSNFALSGSEGTGALVATGSVRTNYSAYSQDLSQWQNGNMSLATDAAVAPNGTSTADIVTTLGTGSHSTYNPTPPATPSDGNYTFSVYVKPGTATWFTVRDVGSYSVFNIVTGALGLSSGIISRNIEALPDGWWRCSISVAKVGGSIQFQCGYPASNAASSNHTTAGLSYHVWGIQVEKGDVATAYIPTEATAVSVADTLTGVGTVRWNATGALNVGQRSNLLIRSQEFDVGATWTPSNSSVTANAALAPDGSTTAERLIDSAASGGHYINQGGIASPASGFATLSIYAKADTLQWLQLFSSTHWVNFNVLTGVIGQKSGSAVAAIEPAGNGYFRCSFTFPATGGSGSAFIILMASDAGAISYTGTGKSLLIWGAQYESGETASAYIPTTTLPVTVGAGTSPVMAGSGLVTSPPVTGTGALTTGVADLDAFGNTASVGLGGGGSVINTGAAMGVTFAIGQTTNPKSAQSFQSVGTSIKAVRLWFKKGTNVSTVGDIVAKVFTSSGNPLDQIGVTSSPLDSTILTATETGYDFTFSPPVAVSQGVEYHIVVETTGLDALAANCPQIGGRTPSQYAGGQWRYHDGSAWQANFSTYDLVTIIDQRLEGGLFASAPVLAGVGFSQVVATSATLVASTATLAGEGFSGATSTSTALQATMPPLTLGTGISSSQSTLGLLTARNPAIIGSGLGPSWVGTGALASAVAILASAGSASWRATGTLPVGVADLDAVGTTTWAASGAMVAQNASTVAPGVSGSTGTATLPSTAATMSGLGSAVTGVGGTGEFIAQSAVITSAGGISRSFGTAILPGTTSAIVAPGLSQSLGTAVLPRAGTTLATLVAIGKSETIGTAALSDQAAVVNSTGISQQVATGTLPAGSSAIVSTGLVRWAATGALVTGASAAAGTGSSFSTVTSAALFASTASLNAFEGVTIISGTGTLPAQSHALAGIALTTSLGTGVLLDATAALAGAGLSRSLGTSTLTSQASVITAPGVSRSQGTGALSSPASVLAGAGAVIEAPTGTGTLAPSASIVNGVGGVALIASGILSAQAAVIASAGIVLDAVTGTGTLAPTAADLDAVGSIGAAPSGSGVLAPYSASLNALGIRQWAATGALSAQASTVTGTAVQGWVATGTLVAQAPVAIGTGVATWAATGALPAGVATLAGAGVSRSTGTAPLAAARASVFGAEGVVVIQGTGELEAQSRALAGAGVSRSFGFGSLVVPDSADLIAVGAVASRGSGALAAGTSDLEGLGAGQAQGVGALAGQPATVITSGGAVLWRASGALVVQAPALAGLAVSASRGPGVLAAADPAVAGAGISATWGDGALTSRPAIIYGSAFLSTAGFGELEAQGRVIVGTGFGLSRGTGVLDVENFAQLVGSGISRSVGTGAIVPKPAKVAGFATLTAYGAGVLEPLDATISGNDLVEGAGVIDAAVCELVGIGEVGEYIAPPPTELPGSYPGTLTWYGSVTEAPRVPSAWWLREAA